MGRWPGLFLFQLSGRPDSMDPAFCSLNSSVSESYCSYQIFFRIVTLCCRRRTSSPVNIVFIIIHAVSAFWLAFLKSRRQNPRRATTLIVSVSVNCQGRLWCQNDHVLETARVLASLCPKDTDIFWHVIPMAKPRTSVYVHKFDTMPCVYACWCVSALSLSLTLSIHIGNFTSFFLTLNISSSVSNY